MSSLARTERAALADLFAELGPNQPTLCEGWQTSDLLAHLLVRERRFDAALGILVPALTGHTARVSASYATRGWDEQIELYRSGPPSWNPMAWGPIDERVNGGEMFIHHEDARRGQPDWLPRVLDPDTHAQVVRLLGSPVTTLPLKKLKLGITGRITDDPDQNDRPVVLTSGTPALVVRGGVAEILLWAAGRKQIHVELDGDAEALEAVRTASLSR